MLSFNNAKAPLNNLKLRQAIRTAIDHKALMDTCWAGKGTLIGSMVPPTDPWYEDRTGDFPYDQAKAKALLAESGSATPTLRLRIPHLPYAIACGQVVKSQLEQVGITVNLDQLEFPAAWLQTVFKDHDYDMSIVAHVEPRDLPAVFGNPQYYTQYNNPQLQADIAAADAGTTDEQVTNMKKAAQELSQDAAADFLFLLPNLIVADTSDHRAAEERDHRVVRPVGPREGVSSRRPVATGRRARRVGDVILRVLQRLGILVVSLLVSSVLVFAFMAVLPGDPARVALGVNASDEAVAQLREQFGLDRPLVVQYLDWLGGLLTFRLGNSYVSGAPIGPQVADRLQVTLWLVVDGHGHRDADRDPARRRSRRCATASRRGRSSRRSPRSASPCRPSWPASCSSPSSPSSSAGFRRTAGRHRSWTR